MAQWRILVADDSADVTSVVDVVLKRDGRFDIYHARNGEDAINIAREVLPDVMVLDIMMPRVHGLKVCKTLKEDAKTQNIRIIMLSALGREYTKREAYQYGANAFMTKPFSPRDLVTSIEDVLKEDANRAPTDQVLGGQVFVFNRGDVIRVFVDVEQPDMGGVVMSRIPPGQWRENEWGYRIALDNGADIVVKWSQVTSAGSLEKAS
ncbi:MAG: response regulator [Chloroflexi bacterium]|nr:response regulator [Chloroflexota bacterium]MDA1173486.1 response regulator [Chloroflexota bacterium]